MTVELLVNRKAHVMHRRLDGHFVDERCNTDALDDFFVVDDGLLETLLKRYQPCKHCMEPGE